MLAIWKAIIVAIAATLGYFSHFVGPFKYQNYSAVDQVTQQVIEYETGYKFPKNDPVSEKKEEE